MKKLSLTFCILTSVISVFTQSSLAMEHPSEQEPAFSHTTSKIISAPAVPPGTPTKNSSTPTFSTPGKSPKRPCAQCGIRAHSYAVMERNFTKAMSDEKDLLEKISALQIQLNESTQQHQATCNALHPQLEKLNAEIQTRPLELSEAIKERHQTEADAKKQEKSHNNERNQWNCLEDRYKNEIESLQQNRKTLESKNTNLKQEIQKLQTEHAKAGAEKDQKILEMGEQIANLQQALEKAQQTSVPPPTTTPEEGNVAPQATASSNQLSEHSSDDDSDVLESDNTTPDETVISPRGKHYKKNQKKNRKKK